LSFIDRCAAQDYRRHHREMVTIDHEKIAAIDGGHGRQGSVARAERGFELGHCWFLLPEIFN